MKPRENIAFSLCLLLLLLPVCPSSSSSAPGVNEKEFRYASQPPQLSSSNGYGYGSSSAIDPWVEDCADPATGYAQLYAAVTPKDTAVVRSLFPGCAVGGSDLKVTVFLQAGAVGDVGMARDSCGTVTLFHILTGTAFSVYFHLLDAGTYYVCHRASSSDAWTAIQKVLVMAPTANMCTFLFSKNPLTALASGASASKTPTASSTGGSAQSGSSGSDTLSVASSSIRADISASGGVSERRLQDGATTTLADTTTDTGSGGTTASVNADGSTGTTDAPTTAAPGGGSAQTAADVTTLAGGGGGNSTEAATTDAGNSTDTSGDGVFSTDTKDTTTTQTTLAANAGVALSGTYVQCQFNSTAEVREEEQVLYRWNMGFGAVVRPMTTQCAPDCWTCYRRGGLACTYCLAYELTTDEYGQQIIKKCMRFGLKRFSKRYTVPLKQAAAGL